MSGIIDLSILIVNYMTYDKTVNTIESILRFTKDVSYEILLVDNGSPNDDYERLSNYVINIESVKLIKSDKNLGFAGGNNLALMSAQGKYILFLNSDTELTGNSLYKAIKYFEDNKGLGALGTRLIDPEGNLDHGCKRGFPTPEASLYYFMKLDKLFPHNTKFGSYKLSYLSEYEKAEVDVISGAFFMTLKSIIDDLGSFDEVFFMYGEDIDLCYRIKKSGLKIVYNPDLGNVIHYKGASGKKRRWRTLYHFYNTMIIFYNKNYRKNYNILVTASVYIGIYTLLVVMVLKNLIKKEC